MKVRIFNKSSGEINILRSTLVYSYAVVSSLFFGGLFLWFGKDYLVDSGQIIFIVCTLLAVSLITFTFIKLQARFVAAATELRRTAEEEEFERHRTLTLINSIKDAVILVDEAGYVSLYNAATLDLLDTNVGISRKPIKEVIKSESDPSFDILESMKKIRGSLEVPYKRLSKAGEILNLKITISRAKTGYGKIGTRGFVVVIKKLEEAGSSGFDAKTLHDLKNGFAAIEGGIENAILMLGKGNSESAKKALEACFKVAGDFKAKAFKK